MSIFNNPVKMIGIGAAVFVGIITAMNCFTIVEPGKEKAGATFGTVNEVPYTAGFHFVNPLMDFYQYDLQEMTYTWDNIGVPAQDNLKTSMDVSVTGRFLPGAAPQVRKLNGSAEGFMQAQVNKRVRAMVIEVGKELAKDSQDFYGEKTLAVMEDEIITRLNDELNPRGYEITAVKFSDINLPNVVTSAIIKTKEAQQRINTQQATLDIQEKKAQEAVNTAKAKADAAKLDRLAAKERADAQLYAMQMEAEGNKALAASVTPNLIKLKQAEAALKWDGKMPQTMLGEGTNMLMQMK